MKKMFTLLTGLLMAVAVMAADRRPMVTVNSMQNFRVVIDGRSFFTNSGTIHLANLRDGRHSIQVFEMKRGYSYGRHRREELVASSTFRLDRRDVKIMIDRFGNISIREQKRNGNGRFERNDRDYRDWDDKDWNDRDWDRNDRDGRDDRNGRF